MPTTFFLVRAVVAAQLREKFDHWYATDHLPWAWPACSNAGTQFFSWIPAGAGMNGGGATAS
jgi:hypothetical protein